MKRQGPPERATRALDASPQTGKGHGHTELSNELLEAVYRFPFTAAQLRAFLFVLRDSYGWKRKETRAHTFTQIEVEIGMARCTAFRAFSELSKLGAIQATKDGGWAPVKNYNAWGATPELPLEHSVPLAERSASGTDERSTGAKKVFAGATNRSASGTLIGEIKLKKERKGEAPQLLPNQRTDTPTARAELGAHDYPPQDHPDFRRLSFKLQDRLAERWEAVLEEARKRTACRRCSTRPKASDAWAYCRPCTVCARCSATLGGGRLFNVVRHEIVCSDCKETTT